MGDVITIPDGRLESTEEERQIALLDAEVWSSRIELAKSAYGSAVDRCLALGLTPTEIARAVGKTEAAIRMHRDRRNT